MATSQTRGSFGGYTYPVTEPDQRYSRTRKRSVWDSLVSVIF